MLARTLGFRSRAAMYDALTAEELTDWEAGYAIDPWGEERADLRNGILCSLTDACHRDKGSPSPPVEYMPYVKDLRQPDPEQTEEQMQEIWKNVVKSMGGKLK